METFKNEGRLYFPANNGTPCYKRYLDEMPGVALQNVWDDIKVISSSSKERIGYPTQKPEALMERIIKMASNEGDMVLDPFVGGGTTVAVADRLGRQWVGIDQSVQAVKVTEGRLNQQRNLFQKPFTTTLHKYDYDTLRYKDALEFEDWIVTQYGGTPNAKKRGDLGLDGKDKEGRPIQVKRSDDVGRNVVDNFASAVRRFDKAVAACTPIGTIIAFSFGKGAVQEVARLRNSENIYIELKKVEDIVSIAKKPALTLAIASQGRDPKGVWEIKFTATASSDVGIAFYSWDFEHHPEQGFKPTLLMEETGCQSHKFKPGRHTIAVKVIDEQGMESTEVLTLNVNGEVRSV